MKKITIFFFATVILNISLFLGCGAFSQETLAFIEAELIEDFDHSEFNSITLSLQKDEKIYFWTDLDVEFTGNVDLVYLLKVTEPDNTITKYEIRPFDEDKRTITINEKKIVINNSTKWSFTSYYYSFIVENEGEHTFECALTMISSSDKTTNIINKSNLIIKR